jgi:putative heme iron utilization protein
VRSSPTAHHILACAAAGRLEDIERKIKVGVFDFLQELPDELIERNPTDRLESVKVQKEPPTPTRWLELMR